MTRPMWHILDHVLKAYLDRYIRAYLHLRQFLGFIEKTIHFKLACKTLEPSVRYALRWTIGDN